MLLSVVLGGSALLVEVGLGGFGTCFLVSVACTHAAWLQRLPRPHFTTVLVLAFDPTLHRAINRSPISTLATV
jgi:hypothetical protein